MAKEFSFELTRGDTKIIKFGVTDEDGNALNLTSSDQIYFTIKKSYKTSNIVLQKLWNTTDTTNKLDYEDGYVVVSLDHNNTKDLDYGTYVYDIEVNLSNGSLVTTTWEGDIDLTDEATWN